MSILLFLTLVIYEPNSQTNEITVYDYEEETEIEVICPEGIDGAECIEPRQKKPYITLEDIRECADNDLFF